MHLLVQQTPSVRQTARRSLRWMLLVAITAACSGSEKPTGTPGGGTDNVVASVTLTNAPTALIFVGDSTRLIAAAVNASGGVVSNQSTTWASSVPAVATISASGMLVAGEAGSTLISATVAGKVAQATITVALGGTIGAAGGSVSASAGRFQFTIPAGVVLQPTQFIVRPALTLPADPRALAASAIELTPSGVAFRFTPAQLTLPYDPATLPPTLARESLQLYMLDSSAWIRMPGSSVNATTRSVTGMIRRTGIYVVRSTPVERIVLSGVAVGGAIYAGDTATIGVKLFAAPFFDSLPPRPIAWTSSAPGVISVDSTGKLTARSAGTSTITAATDGKSATTTTTVTNRSTGDWSRAAEWTTHGGNAQHTGYVDATVDPLAFRLRWSIVPMTGASLYEVTTGGGGVYANSWLRFAGQALVSLDQATGAQRWRNAYSINDRVTQSTWDTGSLYVQTVNGANSFLRAINAADGSEQYASPYASRAGPWYDGPIVVGTSLVMGSASTVFGFAKATGAQLFSRAVSNTDYWTAAAENGTAYIVDGGVTGFAPATGAVSLQLVDSRLTEGVTPVIAAPGVLVAKTTGHMLAVNLAASTVSWAVEGEFDNFLVAANGKVFAFESGALTARSLVNGSSLWTWMPPETCGARMGMVVTNNVLFVGCEETTYALDLTTHLPIWTYPVGGYMALSGPQGALYVSKGQTLTAISLR